MNQSRLRRSLLIGLMTLAGLASHSAVALSPPPPTAFPSEGSEERQIRLKRLAAIPFVQLQVTVGPDDDRMPGFGLIRCHVEGVVRRSFQRSDILPVGRHILVRTGCAARRKPNFVETEPGVRLDIDSEPLLKDLGPGALLQMHLLPTYGPEDAFDKIGEVIVLRRLSRMSADDRAGEEQRARHLNDYVELERPPAPGPGDPPHFPTRDVVVAYRILEEPAVVFRTFYQSRRWRARTEFLAGAPVSPVILTDGFAAQKALVYDEKKAYRFPVIDARREPLGKVHLFRNLTLTPVGVDNVAGLHCTKYRVASGNDAQPLLDTCMTGDGVQLRYRDGYGRTVEAIDVRYQPVSPGLVALPHGYRCDDTLAREAAFWHCEGIAARSASN